MNKKRDTEAASSSCSGAFILILLGILFLLSNFGVLPWSVWEIIGRFWPVALILFGLEILIGGTLLGNIIFGVIGLLFFVGIVLLGLWVANTQLEADLIQQINQWLSQVGLDFLKINL